MLFFKEKIYTESFNSETFENSNETVNHKNKDPISRCYQR